MLSRSICWAYRKECRRIELGDGYNMKSILLLRIRCMDPGIVSMTGLLDMHFGKHEMA